MTDLPETIRQTPRYQAEHAAREANASRARQDEQPVQSLEGGLGLRARDIDGAVRLARCVERRSHAGPQDADDEIAGGGRWHAAVDGVLRRKIRAERDPGRRVVPTMEKELDLVAERRPLRQLVLDE